MFAMQGRLVRYLHDRLGFTVIAWEASLWTCETDPRFCVGWPWGYVVETRDVRDFERSSGIHVTGFDFQMTGRHRDESIRRFEDELLSRVAPDAALVARLTTAFGRFPKRMHFYPLTVAERDQDRQAFVDALAALDPRTMPVEGALLRRTVENVVSLYDWHAAVHADVSTKIDWNHAAFANVRDREMARNVEWLLRTRYPGQKLILWLASIHASRDLSVVTRRADDDERGDRAGYKTMGMWLSDALGPEYFAVSMSAYEGAIGNLPVIAESTVSPAHSGSIEQAWAPKDKPFQIVSFKTFGDAVEEGRFIGLHGFLAPWSRVFDAGIVFKTVTPATPEHDPRGFPETHSLVPVR